MLSLLIGLTLGLCGAIAYRVTDKILKGYEARRDNQVMVELLGKESKQ